MDGNNLRILTKETFKTSKVRSLTDLSMTNCRLHLVSDHALLALTRLRTINLSNNNLTSLPTQVHSLIHLSSQQLTWQMEDLFLATYWIIMWEAVRITESTLDQALGSNNSCLFSYSKQQTNWRKLFWVETNWLACLHIRNIGNIYLHSSIFSISMNHWVNSDDLMIPNDIL